MALINAIGKQLLDKTNFITLLHKVKAVINERLITYVDSDTITVINPIDFLNPEVSLSCGSRVTNSRKEQPAPPHTSKES